MLQLLIVILYYKFNLYQGVCVGSLGFFLKWDKILKFENQANLVFIKLSNDLV